MNPIEASVTLEEATSRRWDVVVVGAGCAGATAAHGIARLGASTLLVDKSRFPRWKVCGGCLNRRALAALDAVGLGSLPSDLGAVPVHEFHLAADGAKALIPLPNHAAISREALDAALVETAMASGAAFLPETRAVCAEDHGDFRTVRVRSGENQASLEARLVLAADGLGGRLLKDSDSFDSPSSPESRIGAGAMVDSAHGFYEDGIIYMACGTCGYVGATRVEDGRLDMAAALDASIVKELGLPHAVALVLNEAGFPQIPAIHDSTWRGTPALSRRATAVWANRALVLGDATGYVEPFTGEGMAWALTSGAAVADLAVRGVEDFSPSIGFEWERRHRHIVSDRQGICRILTATLRRPVLVACLLRIVSRAPSLARPLVNRMNASARLETGICP